MSREESKWIFLFSEGTKIVAWDGVYFGEEWAIPRFNGWLEGGKVPGHVTVNLVRVMQNSDIGFYRRQVPVAYYYFYVPIPFLEWLRQIKQNDRGGDDVVHDFAVDALSDKSFPAEIESIEQLVDYLTQNGACDEAILAGKEAWFHYCRRRFNHDPKRPSSQASHRFER